MKILDDIVLLLLVFGYWKALTNSTIYFNDFVALALFIIAAYTIIRAENP